jgi:hypothetical protein
MNSSIHHVDTSTILRFVLAILACITLCVTPLHAADHSAGFDSLIAAGSENRMIRAVLFLDNRLTMDEVYPVAASLPMDARRQYVVHALKARFHDIGDGVMKHLDDARNAGQVKLLRPLWVLNGIRVTATPAVFRDIEKLFPVITYIVSDLPYPETLDGLGWGVADMQAVRVWSELGADGSGVIVGAKDSGVDYTHPGFAGRIWTNQNEVPDNGIDDDGNGYVDDYRGWNFDDDNNNVQDRDGHGTKTASVIAGGFYSHGGTVDTVGVAPGARIMILSAFITQSAVWEASQYAMEMGASVISASLSFKQSYCYQGLILDCPNYVAHRFVSEMELAAGLLHANSTGDYGLQNPVPLSIPAPANSPPPAMTPAHTQQGGVSSMISVSAYNPGVIYYTGSGHGPSGWSREDICVDPRMAFCGPAGSGSEYPERFNDYPYHQGTLRGLAKPDIAAPTIISTFSAGGGISSVNGTSGATPHVGGACALIYSKFPGITPEAAYRFLVFAAADSGPPGFDSLWGFGRIRPFAACSAGVATITMVSGHVTENGGSLLAGVSIFADTSRPVLTDNNGNYSIWLPRGSHQLHFRKFGFQDTTITVVLISPTYPQNATMTAAPPSMLTLTAIGNGVSQANIPVTIPESSLRTFTDSDGMVVENLYAGTYHVTYGALPWSDTTIVITVTAGTTAINLPLIYSPRARPTGPDSAGYYIYDDFDVSQARYDWVEINPDLSELHGTVLPITGDGIDELQLPFSMPFYGQAFSSISVGANGYIAFGHISFEENGELPIPSPALPDGYLAVWLTDLLPDAASRILFYSQPDSQRVIVEWYNVPTNTTLGIELRPARGTFEAILYANGNIRCVYNELHGQFETTVGIENLSGTNGLQYVYQQQYEAHAAPIDSSRSLLFTQEVLSDAAPRPLPVVREFSLHQNFPNPFNPTTTFSWIVPYTIQMKLVLYDVLGRQAAVVYNGVCNTGTHEIRFDASALSTGIYFARMESAGRSLAIRKVMLLK